MILTYVPKHSHSIKKLTPCPNSIFFRKRNLDMIYIIIIPNRFKNSVCKPKRKYILQGLFSQVMIDSKNLPFLKNFRKFFIQSNRGFQIFPKRFFYNNSCPFTRLMLVLRSFSGGGTTAFRKFC